MATNDIDSQWEPFSENNTYDKHYFEMKVGERTLDLYPTRLIPLVQRFGLVLVSSIVPGLTTGDMGVGPGGRGMRKGILKAFGGGFGVGWGGFGVIFLQILCRFFTLFGRIYLYLENGNGAEPASAVPLPGRVARELQSQNLNPQYMPVTK